MLLILCNISLAQEKDYNEILKNTKNVKSAYVSDNSMLLKMSNNKIILIDLVSNEEKDINITARNSEFSQAKNDIFFITQTEGEKNHHGILINRKGEKKSFPISTYNSKISENGKHIITHRNDYFGGRFQVFDAKTLQEFVLPKRVYSSFIADFIDSNRVFLLYQGIARKYNNINLDSLKDENLKKAKNKEISHDVYKVNQNELYEIHKSRRRRGSNEKDFKTKYLIYNIITQKIEFEAELIIDNIKYNFFPEINTIGVSEEGNKVLISAFSDNNKYLIHNRLIEIDLTNNRIIDISNNLNLSSNDAIKEIFYLNDNDFVLVVYNKGIAKYFYSTNESLFQTELKITGKFIGERNRITIEDNNIIIMDIRNKKYVWDYKNENSIKIYSNNYPVFSTNAKILKTNEVQK